MNIDYLREIIKESIRRIKEQNSEIKQLRLELERDKRKKEKAIKEINKLENEIKTK
jgi:septal ring factor EnvC (AmiA/AmiB activator)